VTQLVNIETCPAVSGVDLRAYRRAVPLRDADNGEQITVANRSEPSARSISAANGLNWLADGEEFLMTSTGPPGPWSGGGGGGLAVVKDQLTGIMTLPPASAAPLTAAV
jgi:hypothetical protein